MFERWTCPTPLCGKRASSYSQVLAESYWESKSESGPYLLAHGVMPHDAYEVPISYDTFITCENGHEHYIETKYVTK